MVKRRRTHTRDFKLEAVRLVEYGNESVPDVAERLGLHPNLLYRWRKELVQDGEEAFPGRGKLRDSEEEVRQLRRELARVREERDVLKKAIAFFAKESK